MYLSFTINFGLSLKTSYGSILSDLHAVFANGDHNLSVLST